MLLFLLCAGCGGSASVRSPFGSSQDEDAGDATVPMEERIADLEQSVERLEDLVRGMNADLAAHMDVFSAQLRTLNAKATAQNQLLRKAMLSGQGRSDLEGKPNGQIDGLPRPGRAVAYLDGTAQTGTPSGESSLMRPPLSQQSVAESASWEGNVPLLPVSQRQLPEATGGGKPLGDSLTGDLGGSALQPETPRISSREIGGQEQDFQDVPDEGKRLYDLAYKDLMQENFQLALIQFRSFLDRYPGTRLSDNAQYWIGEVYYAQRQFGVAIEEFRKVMEEYSGQDKVPAACYKIALSFERMQDQSTAKRYLEFLLEHFPDTREAQLAKERLSQG